MDDQRTPLPGVADAFAGSLAGAAPAPVVDAPSTVEAPRPALRSAYDRELAEIKDNILRMGSLVESQVRAASAALLAHDAEAGTAVIVEDRKVNELQRKVTAMVAAVIATQAPVARDLRYLLTLDHVSYELERMGDHAASVAKRAVKLAGRPHLLDPEFGRMGELVATQVHGIVHALVDIDEHEARTVALGDDEIDALNRTNLERLVQRMRDDPALVEPGAHLMLASHYLERIGDRVTNIAEDIVFLASGEVEDLNP